VTLPAALRTPDARFDALPGYSFAPHYFEHEGLRIHYLDEGSPTSDVTALCLHGNPTWSYLYRKMIPVFSGAGLRVVAPDLIGFGRSDKPAHEAAHTWDLHRGMLLDFVERLNLKNVLLVVQDWGGLLGLTLPMAYEVPKAPLAPAPREGAPASVRPLGGPNRFTRLLAMNTALGTGELSDGFRQWRTFSNSQPDLAVGRLLRRGKPDMSQAEAAAYDAPFPDATYKAALRAFPNLVPDGADAPGAALSREAQTFWRERWSGQSFLAVGMQDPVLGLSVMAALARTVRGSAAPLELPEAGHFVQEWGAPVARAALEHFDLA
jgi:pimeloyl-ACP methyl ester carboxylesterase